MVNKHDPETHHFTNYFIMDGSIRNGNPFINVIAEVEVIIYPMNDEAFPDGTADDVMVTTDQGEIVGASSELSKLIIAQIKDERPQEWTAIREMGERNRKGKVDDDLGDAPLGDWHGRNE